MIWQTLPPGKGFRRKGPEDEAPSPHQLRLQHAPRARCSQRDNPVTGRSASVHPSGHPISQSVNAGFKVRPSLECFSPFSKTTRQGWEETGLPGLHPAASSTSHKSVQDIAAGLMDICFPVWFRSFRKASPAWPSTTQARFALKCAVGVGQNEQPVADVRPADFRR